MMKSDAETMAGRDSGETTGREPYKVTKKDLDGVYWRWLFTSALSWNYETQQSGGIVIALTPLLRKIYPRDEEFREAMLSHYQYYNSQRKLTNVVLGSVVALEENYDPQNPQEVRETVTALKTSLMGPFAGIGDSLLNSIPMTIFASISAYLALQGNPVGLLLGVLFGLCMQPVCRWFMNMGYRYGTNLMGMFADRVGLLTESAQILGITVVGGLVAANVAIPVALEFAYGDVVMSIQGMLDSIMPKMTSVLAVALIYWLLGRRKITTGKCIMIVLAASFVLFNLGVLA